MKLIKVAGYLDLFSTVLKRKKSYVIELSFSASQDEIREYQKNKMDFVTNKLEVE